MQSLIPNTFLNFCHLNSHFLSSLCRIFMDNDFERKIWRLVNKNISGRSLIWHMFAEIGDRLFSNMIYWKNLWNVLTKTKTIYRIGFSNVTNNASFPSTNYSGQADFECIQICSKILKERHTRKRT